MAANSLFVGDRTAMPGGAGYTWTVRLDRAARANALDGPLLRALSDAFRAPEARGARALFLEAAGDVFSAGLDLDWLETLRQGPRAERDAAGRALADALEAVAAVDVPVVAYAGRGAFGAGIALLAAADWTVADPGARFRLSEARLGIAGGVLLKTLRPRVRESDLRRWILTASDFDAAEAEASGLVSARCAMDRWSATKAALRERFAATAPSVTTQFKRAMRAPVPTMTDGKLLADALENPDGAEGLRAFRERRTPRWGADQ